MNVYAFMAVWTCMLMRLRNEQGCDLPAVRRVIQFGVGPCLPSVWQRFGRCGRDGLPGNVIWLLPGWKGPLTKVSRRRQSMYCLERLEACVAAAPLLFDAEGVRREITTLCKGTHAEIVNHFKHERQCYRRLFMKYFGIEVSICEI